MLIEEIAVIEQVSELPDNMQLIYLQLVSAIEAVMSELATEGAKSDHITTGFVEVLVNKLLQKPLSHADLVGLLQVEIRQQLAV